jgi:hypothetical protein
MHEPSLTASYLRALRAALRVSPATAERILAEVEDHLRQATEEEMAAGAAPEEAERRAVERFGTPEEVARSFAGPFPWAKLFWLGLAIAVALPAVIPEVVGSGHSSLYALGLVMSLGYAAGVVAPRHPARAGMLPGLVMAAATLSFAVWLAYSSRDPRWAIQELPTEVLLLLPFGTACVLLGALGGLLGARMRARKAMPEPTH